MEAVIPATDTVLQAPKRAWWQRSFMSTLQSLSATLVIAIFVITFIVQAFQIPSESMEDTLLVGDYLLVDKLSFGPPSFAPLPYEKIKRGDIIVFRYPVDPSQHFVKRVIGVPGDRIHLRNGRVFVNGEERFEPYTVMKAYGPNFYRDNFPTTRAEIPPSVTSEWWNDFPQLIRNGDLLVPEDSYFVMGDNRNNSSDSRYWGLVPRESIEGRPLMIYFSISPAPPATTPANASVRMERFTARMWHLPEVIRWRRAFHFVR
jgi:signal peptidase I